MNDHKRKIGIKMTKIFDIFLDQNRNIIKSALISHKFASKAIGGSTDKETFEKMMHQLGELDFDLFFIHHAEYGKNELVLREIGIDAAWNRIFELNHEDIIIYIPAKEFFLWLPAFEDFHIVFGRRENIVRLTDERFSSVWFSDFIKKTAGDEKYKSNLTDVLLNFT